MAVSSNRPTLSSAQRQEVNEKFVENRLVIFLILFFVLLRIVFYFGRCSSVLILQHLQLRRGDQWGCFTAENTSIIFIITRDVRY